MSLTTLFIVTLFVVVAVAAWIWLRCRRAVEQTQDHGSSVAERSPTNSSQPGDIRRPDVDPQLSPEQIPAVVHVPVIFPPTPPVPLPAIPKATPSEEATTAHRPREVESGLVSKQGADTSDEETGKPQNFHQHESHITRESATQLDISDEKLDEPETPKGAATASTSDVLPRLNAKSESDVRADPHSPPTEVEPTPVPPTYHPPIPPATKPGTSVKRERAPRSTPTANVDLRLRVQLVFGRGGTVKTLALVADRREGMPCDIEIMGTQGKLQLTELRDDCYDPVQVPDIANAILQGVEWRGCGNARRWRWMLGGRPLYVLAPGDEFGLHGFVSTARLWLNARHVVLANSTLIDEVLTALAKAGCGNPEMSDDRTPGVPAGWVLFRDVTPTRAVPMRNEQDILNVLCPAHDVEPHFVGGIRLERNIWLAGFPPRIRLTGELGDGFQVQIDGHLAHSAADGAYEAPAWDAEGEHRLWFGDRTETYSLRTMGENWDSWPAHVFGAGSAICGAGIHQTGEACWHQVRVSVSNPLLLGARPGEILRCQTHHDVRSETIVASVPFAPVWALPIEMLHANKRSARVVLINPFPPNIAADSTHQNRNSEFALRKWLTAINDARHKHLALVEEDAEANALWQRYCAVAKQLWRRKR